MDVTQRLEPAVAKKLIVKIIEEGSISISDHAVKEMEKDGLTAPDCISVMRGGVVEEPGFENGTWRYRIRTQRIYVVVAFRSEIELSIVTTWRIQKR